MYEGNIYNFTGIATGYVQGTMAGGIELDQEVTHAQLIGFSGYVELSSSRDAITGQEITAGHPVTVEPTITPNWVGQPAGEDDDYDDDDDDYDRYTDDDDEDPEDYGYTPAPREGVRFPLQFGDDNIKIILDVEYPSVGHAQELARQVEAAFRRNGVPTLVTTPADEIHAEVARNTATGGIVSKAINHGDIRLGDPRLNGALTALVDGLKAPGVTVHSIEVFDAEGREIESPAIQALFA